jgi:uncharacterized protein (TIGR03083 family)
MGAVQQQAPPRLDPGVDPAPADPVGLADWVRAGAARMVAMLRAADPDSPTWHPFPVEPKVAGLWPRRQAQEASVHRWDAERAAGGWPSIGAAMAADGVDEYWAYMLARMVSREGITVPSSVVAVVTTDTGGRWVTDGRGGAVAAAATGVAPQAELRGTAEAVLLRLWGRPVADGSVTVSGDPAVAGAWLALGGA